MKSQAVAIIGTGLMGAPMAVNLLGRGFEVRAYNRTRAKAEPLAALGAAIFDKPADAVRGADFVVTMLTDGKAVEQVLFAEGVAAAMAAGAVVLDMSSVQPSQARAHAGRLAAMDLGHLDAPVSGGTRGAREASLAIMVGGPETEFERARPVFEAMGRPVRVGPSGAGQLAKLCNQGIVAVTIGAVAEALLLMERAGGEPARLREALVGGFADSVILQQHGRRMTDNDFAPGGYSDLQLKDLDNIVEEMRQAGLHLPLVEMMRERYQRLVRALDGARLDHSAIYLELLERNGIKRP